MATQSPQVPPELPPPPELLQAGQRKKMLIIGGVVAAVIVLIVVAYFMMSGPSLEEQAKRYWDLYPDVAANPEFGRAAGPQGALKHYNMHGKSEGRKWE